MGPEGITGNYLLMWQVIDKSLNAHCNIREKEEEEEEAENARAPDQAGSYK